MLKEKLQEHEILVDEDRIDKVGHIPDKEWTILAMIRNKAIAFEDEVMLEACERLMNLYPSKEGGHADRLVDILKHKHESEQDPASIVVQSGGVEKSEKGLKDS